MEGEIGRIGPNPASAPRAVTPTGRRRRRDEGGRDFEAELEEQSAREAEDAKSEESEESRTRPRSHPDADTGGNVDVVA